MAADDLNPPLGTTTPEIFLDNVKRADRLVNGPEATIPDRGGEPLDTWRQMMAKNDEIRQNLIPLSKQYTTLAEAQADIANIPPGSTTYVRSPDDTALAIEYMNVDGTLVPTGRRMPSQEYTDDIFDGMKTSGLIPEVMNPETGYVLAFRDPVTKRACILVTVTGQVEIPLLQYRGGSIGRQALEEDVQQLVPVSLDPATGYVMAWIDPVTRRMALRVSVTGQVDIPLLKIADGAVEKNMLSENLQGLIPVTLSPESGYVLAWLDPVTRRCALRVSVSGQVEIPMLSIGKKIITAENLTDDLRGAVLPVSQDIVSVYPDAVRSRIADITARTNDKDGSGWSPLSSHICRAMYGVNNTGVSVECRRSFGLKVAGKAPGCPIPLAPCHRLTAADD